VSNTRVNVNNEQLFSTGERVLVTIHVDPMPEPYETVGIIVGTHDEQFQSGDIHSYRILVLNDGQPQNEIKWIHKNKMTSLSIDFEDGKKILESFYGEEIG
jgi:hypothetical protein